MSAARLDPLTCELSGTNLVEASAGTGKTYAIAGLYVRLLVETGLKVDQVLVVTFTEAATEELRGRVRKRVREALSAFCGGPAGDPFLAGLVARAGKEPGGLERGRRRLVLALRSFDEAAIHTIHGFCQRVLREAAFEAGSAFGAEILEDQGPALQEVVDDFWRREMLGAPAVLVRHAVAEGLTPESLAKFVGRRAALPHLTLLPEVGAGAAPPDLGAACEAAFAALAAAWREGGGQAAALLAAHPGLLRTRYRRDWVAAWVEALGAFVAAGDPAGPIEVLDRFCPKNLAQATRPGHEPPRHPLFEACEALRAARDALADELARHLVALKIRCLEHVRRELPRWKADRNVRSFDDLLLDVRGALAGPAGEGLARALRARYRAALIDEFQDTDPVQYEIFRRVFSPGPGGAGDPEGGGGGADPARLFLIGDPKQAIYSFRGADVFAYMHAAGHAEHRYTLGHNWRSAPELIAAVNAAFGRGPAPFVFREIPFDPVDPAPRPDRERLRDASERPGGGEEAPLRIWLVRPPPDKDVLNKGDGAALVAGAVASEVVRLLARGRAGALTLGDAPLAPEHVAVLVRTNDQAREVHRALIRRGVPSVISSAESLFSAPEPAELLRVLAAVADPGDGQAVRAALATDLLGLSGNELAAVLEDDTRWDRWVQRLHGYGEQWRRGGVAPMARALLAAEGVRRRLLAREDGERRLTNVLHCVEVLQGAAAGRKLGPEGVLHWLAAQLASPSGAEEHQMRLETDERAVRVATVHKSKGLEYPVTFVPFPWDGVREVGDEACCHDPHDPLRLVLDLGSERFAEHAALARREEFAENARLLYVALTRAAHRCIVAWGPFRGAETSAPAHVFHPAPRADGSEGPEDPVADAAARVGALGVEGMARELAALARQAGGCLRVEELPPISPDRFEPPRGEARPLRCRRLLRPIPTDWGVTSFSSLASGREEAAEQAQQTGQAPWADRDEGTDDTAPAPADAEAQAEAAARAAGTIFAFPRGTRAGLCLHELFEEAEYTPADPSALRLLAARKLADYGFDPAWTEPVARAAERVFGAVLAPSPSCGGSGGSSVSAGPRLAEVGRADRVNEMEFFLPLARITRDGLARVFADRGGPALPPWLPERLGRLELSPRRGVLRGFVDLVFRHGGRFYLLDWKTNFLGWRVEDYGPQGLARAMKEHLYTLQYCLYAAALHGHLATRLPGYRYEDHFGGAAWVFVRGVDPDRCPGHGVYWDRPPEALVDGLYRYLTTGDAP